MEDIIIKELTYLLVNIDDDNMKPILRSIMRNLQILYPTNPRINKIINLLTDEKEFNEKV